MSSVLNLIPGDEVRLILNDKIIDKAVAIATSPFMKHLMIVWKQYVEPSIEVNTCGPCLERVLKNYKELKPLFEKMYNEPDLLSLA